MHVHIGQPANSKFHFIHFHYSLIILQLELNENEGKLMKINEDKRK